MTYEMEYMARLFSCGAQGIPAEPPAHPVDWDKVVQLAVEQSVTYTVALALRDPNIGCPASIREQLIASQRGGAIKNLLKTERILDIVNDMENAGVRTAVIKGIDAAQFYASPECRVSADSDLLVSPGDEDKALSLLRKHGFNTGRRKKDDLHTMCDHPELGILELHISLLTESKMDEFSGSARLNERALDRTVMKSIYGKQYRALEPTDNMLFLTYHMLAHMVIGGISLRMLMDNALYSKSNTGLIDRDKYNSELSESRYIRVAQLLFGTAVRYLGISPDDLPTEPILDDQGVRMIMTDLEDGGWEGRKSTAGPGVWALQYYRRETALKSNDKAMMSDIRRIGMLTLRQSLFPGSSRMKLDYPVLRKCPALSLFCWLHRLFKVGVPWLRRGGMRKVVMPSGDESRLSEEARERLELYRRLELL